MKDNKSKILSLILPITSLLSIVICWGIASFSVNNEFILPSIKSTVESFFMLLNTNSFYTALLNTFLRSLIGFIISFIIAFILAIFSVKKPLFRSFISPIISIMRALPTIAVVLILLVWTSSLVAPVIVTALVVLPTIFTYIESAFSSLDKTVSDAGKVDGANSLEVFRWVEFPQALPSVYSAIGSGISLNFKLMVASEVISQTANSLGFLLNTSKVYFETAQMFALVCVSVIVGVIIETIFNKLSKKAGEWK